MNPPPARGKSGGDTTTGPLDTAVSVPNEQGLTPSSPFPSLDLSALNAPSNAPSTVIGELDQTLQEDEGEQQQKDEPLPTAESLVIPDDSIQAIDSTPSTTTEKMGKKAKNKRQGAQTDSTSVQETKQIIPSEVDQHDVVSEPRSISEPVIAAKDDVNEPIPDDAWAEPAEPVGKKGKKGKGKKKKVDSLVIDETSTSELVEQAAQSVPETVPEAAPSHSQEESMDGEMSRSGPVERSTEDALTEQTASSSKKSKKDKKKKKQVNQEPSDLPPSEPEQSPLEPSDELAEPAAPLETSQSEALPEQSQSTDLSRPEQPLQDDLRPQADISGKKSKKDKKKRGSKSPSQVEEPLSREVDVSSLPSTSEPEAEPLVENDAIDPNLVADTSSQPQLEVSEDAVAAVEPLSTLDELSAPSQEASEVPEESLEQESSSQAHDTDDAVLNTKQGKRDKKKRQSVTFTEPLEKPRIQSKDTKIKDAPLSPVSILTASSSREVEDDNQPAMPRGEESEQLTSDPAFGELSKKHISEPPPQSDYFSEQPFVEFDIPPPHSAEDETPIHSLSREVSESSLDKKPQQEPFQQTPASIPSAPDNTDFSIDEPSEVVPGDRPIGSVLEEQPSLLNDPLPVENIVAQVEAPEKSDIPVELQPLESVGDGAKTIMRTPFEEGRLTSGPIQDSSATVTEDESTSSAKKSKKDKKKKRQSRLGNEVEPVVQSLTAEDQFAKGDENEASGSNAPLPTTTESSTSGVEPEPIAAQPDPVTIEQSAEVEVSASKKSKKDKKSRKGKVQESSDWDSPAELIVDTSPTRVTVDEQQPVAQNEFATPTIVTEVQLPQSSQQEPIAREIESTPGAGSSDSIEIVNEPQPSSHLEEDKPGVDNKLSDLEPESRQMPSHIDKDAGDSPADQDASPYSIRKAKKDKKKKKVAASTTTAKSESEPWPLGSPELAALDDAPFATREIERLMKQLSTVEEESEPVESSEPLRVAVTPLSGTQSFIAPESEAVASIEEEDGDGDVEDHVYSLKRGKKEKKKRRKGVTMDEPWPRGETSTADELIDTPIEGILETQPEPRDYPADDILAEDKELAGLAGELAESADSIVEQLPSEPEVLHEAEIPKESVPTLPTGDSLEEKQDVLSEQSLAQDANVVEGDKAVTITTPDNNQESSIPETPKDTAVPPETLEVPRSFSPDHIDTLASVQKDTETATEPTSAQDADILMSDTMSKDKGKEIDDTAWISQGPDNTTSEAQILSREPESAQDQEADSSELADSEVLPAKKSKKNKKKKRGSIAQESTPQDSTQDSAPQDSAPQDSMPEPVQVSEPIPEESVEPPVESVIELHDTSATKQESAEAAAASDSLSEVIPKKMSKKERRKTKLEAQESSGLDSPLLDMDDKLAADPLPESDVTAVTDLLSAAPEPTPITPVDELEQLSKPLYNESSRDNGSEPTPTPTPLPAPELEVEESPLVSKKSKKSKKKKGAKQSDSQSASGTATPVISEVSTPAVEQPSFVEELATVEEPKPVVEEPVARKLVIQEPVIEEPVIEELVVEKSIVEEPIVAEQPGTTTKELDLSSEQLSTPTEQATVVDRSAEIQEPMVPELGELLQTTQPDVVSSENPEPETTPTIPTKRSKKEKKRKGSKLPDSELASGSQTPVAESSTFTDMEPTGSPIEEGPSSQILSDSVTEDIQIEDQPVQQDAPPEDSSDLPTKKKSKKGKNKNQKESKTADSEPVVQEPVTSVEPVVDGPITLEPVVDEPVSVEPVVDEVATVEPALDGLSSLEPAVDEPTTVEPILDEQATVETIVDEPVTVEPIVHEPLSSVEPEIGAAEPLTPTELADSSALATEVPETHLEASLDPPTKKSKKKSKKKGSKVTTPEVASVAQSPAAGNSAELEIDLPPQSTLDTTTNVEPIIDVPEDTKQEAQLDPEPAALIPVVDESSHMVVEEPGINIEPEIEAPPHAPLDSATSEEIASFISEELQVEESSEHLAKKSKKSSKKDKKRKGSQLAESGPTSGTATPALEDQSSSVAREVESPLQIVAEPVTFEEPSSTVINTETPAVEEPVPEAILEDPVEASVREMLQEEPQPEPETTSALPVKKSKKDKKRKGSKLAESEPASGTVTPAVEEQSVSIPHGLQYQEQRGIDASDLPEPTIGLADEVSDLVEDIQQDTPSEETSNISSKKSKKAKKRKGSKATDSEPASGTLTPVQQEPAIPEILEAPPTVEEPLSEILDAIDNAQQSISRPGSPSAHVLEHVPAIEDNSVQGLVDKPQVAHEEIITENLDLSSGIMEAPRSIQEAVAGIPEQVEISSPDARDVANLSSSNEAEPSLPEDIINDLPSDVIAGPSEEIIARLPEPSTLIIDEAQPPTSEFEGLQEPSNPEDQDRSSSSQTPQQKEPETQPEYPLDMPVKKSKKDKKNKKNKGSKIAESESASGSQTPVTEELITTVLPEADVSSLTGITEPEIGQIERAIDLTDEPAPIGEVSKEEQLEDLPAPPTKKSKKDKKRKGSKAPESEPASGTMTPAIEEPATSALPEIEAALPVEPTSPVEVALPAEDAPLIDAVQPEQIERGTDLTEEPVPISEIKEPEEQPEETWAIPAKKSKKDKKRKGSKIPESEPTSGTMTPATEEPAASAPESELSLPVDPSFIPVSTPSDTRNDEQIDDALVVPAKKSKKDKKRKGKQQAGSEPTSGTLTPTLEESTALEAEPIVPEAELTALEVAPVTRKVESVVPEAEPAAPEVEPTVREVEPASEVEVVVPEVQSAAPDVEPTSLEVAPIAQPAASDAEPATLEVEPVVTKLETSAPMVHIEPEAVFKEEPGTIEEPKDMQPDDAWALPTKKSKKGKKDKKGKGSQQVESEPASGTMTPIQPPEDIVAETSALDPEPSEKTGDRGLDSEVIRSEQLAETEDTWSAPAKKSKKEKRKSKAASTETALEDSPPSAEAEIVEVPEITEASVEKNIETISEPVQEASQATPEEAEAVDEWAAPSKKTKKGKKKGKKSASAPDSGSATPKIVAPEDDAPAIEAIISDSPGVESLVIEAPAIESVAIKAPIAEAVVEAPMVEVEAIIAEDVFESPVAETIVETLVVETPAVEAAIAEDPVETPIAKTVAEIPAVETPVVETPVAEATIAEAVVETPAVETPANHDIAPEDSPIAPLTDEPTDFDVGRDLLVSESTPMDAGFPEISTKRSKKDKKKKGKKSESVSPSGLESSTDREVATTPEIVPDFDTTARTAPVNLPIDDGLSGSNSKKSKKDKKKRKGLAMAFEDEVPISSASENALVDDKLSEIISRENVQERQVPDEVPGGQFDELTKSVNPQGLDDVDGIKPKSTSPAQTPAAEAETEKVEFHPAILDALGKSPSDRTLERTAAATLPMTIGLGLITSPPVLYPQGAPSPKLLTALDTPLPGLDDEEGNRLDAFDTFRNLDSVSKPEYAEKEGHVDLTPAQERSHVSHDPPFDYTSGRKRAKIKELDPTELPEPVISARDIAASFMESQGHKHTDEEGVQDPIQPEAKLSVQDPMEPLSVEPVETSSRESAPTLTKISKRESIKIAAAYLDGQPVSSVKEAGAQSKDIAQDHQDIKLAKEEASEPSARELAAEFLERPLERSRSDAKGKGKMADKSDDIAAAAAAGALVGGVASLAAKFGGVKKNKGGKPKKIIDKRSVREDDMFDDPSLWEGADRRPLEEGSRMEVNQDDFWNVPEGDVNMDEDNGEQVPISEDKGVEMEIKIEEQEMEQMEQEQEKPATRSVVMQEEEVDDKIAARSVVMHEQEVEDVGSMDLDKPLQRDGPSQMTSLGRQDSETIPKSVRQARRHSRSPASPSRRQEAREWSKSPSPVRRVFSFPDDIADEEAFSTRAPEKEDDNKMVPLQTAMDQAFRAIPRVSSVSDFKRSHASLPPVQEEVSDEEPAKGYTTKRDSRHRATTPEPNRDSGFVSDSPHISRRFQESEGLRDSGVHLRDWPEGTPQQRDSHRFESQAPRTPRSSITSIGEDTHGDDKERRFRRSPLRSPMRSPDKLDRLGPDTPRLREPSPPPRTPEPEKLTIKKRATVGPVHQKHQQESGGASLVPAAAAAAVVASVTPVTRAIAPVTPATVPVSVAAHRSVSESQQQHQSRLSPRLPTDPAPRRSASNTSISRLRTPEPLGLRPDSPGSAGSAGSLRSYTGTPPLRRVDKRVSGDLRSVSRSQRDLAAKAKEEEGERSAATAAGIAVAAAGAAALGSLGAAELASTSSSSSRAAHNITPVANEGRVRAKDMTDVYDGYGEGRLGSPRSPTRPHSMRRRQSMQVLELESRVAQLAEENRMLAEARAQAEVSSSNRNSSALAERETEIESLKRMLQEANEVIERLKQTNEGLRSSTSAIAVKHHEEVRRLENDHALTARELDQVRGAQAQQARVVQDKDTEIAGLRAQLDAIKEQIRELQQQILESSKPTENPDFLDAHDVDYFDHRCQQLSAHVHQWVLRFSKFSDMRACRLTSEINDEKLIDRLDNAVLDGSDVDTYLEDRVRRRDIFMSMTMTMIWEFVFTRYLFGMDREQRQKLKQLEKQLLDVGPVHAVRQWRAITLTLLSRRPAFKRQRDQDTEAVVQAILDGLGKILPPPSNLEDQIQTQLRRVVREAVGLAIEMRSQRAEYMMLPPLQPEYDESGDLTETVAFNAALMSERSGDSSVTSEELEAAGTTVRVVLFPLVIRKGDETGRGDDEVVVCPAQVLVAKPTTPGKKAARMATPSSDAGGVSLFARSGGAPSDVTMGEGGHMEGGIRRVVNQE